MHVLSNSDCLSEIGDPTVFWTNRDFWLRVGLTTVVSEGQDVVVPPTGRGFVANKNKVIGMVRSRV